MKKIIRAGCSIACAMLLTLGFFACGQLANMPEAITPSPPETLVPTPTAEAPVQTPVEPEITPTPRPAPTLPPEMDPAVPWTQLLGKPNASQMAADIEYLCRSPREYGGEAEKRAAEWAAEWLLELGYETSVVPASGQGTEFERREGESELKLDAFGSASIKAGPVSGTHNGSVEGTLIFVSSEDDLAGDMRDAICLLPPGVGNAKALMHEAAQRGCKGAVYNTMDLKNPVDGPDYADGLVALSVESEEAIKLMTMLVQGNEAPVILTVKGSSWDFETQNVVAVRASKRDADIIIIGAHIDSMVGAPGATDNACGVAAVLECASLLQKFVGDVELRLILIGAEEGGALGARAYVAQMPEGDRTRVRGMLNLDMFASLNGEPVFYGASKRNDALRAAIISAQRVRELEPLKAITLSKKETPTGDHLAFDAAGISAVMIAHKPIEGEYHMPDDTQDKIDMDKMLWIAESAAAWAASQIHPVS